AVWLPDIPGAVNGFWAEKGGAGERHWPIVFCNTAVPQIFSHERFGGDGYQIKVPGSGPYAVRLYFAEGFEGTYRPGLRVYDVSIEGRKILEDFDPVEAGGGFARASIFEVRSIPVEDGQLSIGLEDKVGKNLINAIEVFEDSDAPDEMTVQQILGPADRQAMEIPNAARRKPLRVFYVGNSHTFFWAIPETTAAMVNAVPGRVRLYPYRLLHGGWVLNRFYSKRNDAEAPYAPDVIRAGKYDVAVLQLLPNDDPEFNQKMLEALEAFGQAADEAGTRLMLYIFNPLERMDDASREKLLAMVRERDMVVVPFGEARQALFQQLSNAPVELSLRGVGPHLGFHPAYLDACMHFIAWTGQSPEGHPMPTLVGQDVRVSEEAARWLEKIAWEAYGKAKEKYELRHYGETHQ
ncbi:MAG: malectin domain-containing carbohydrate-binding protein, partial [Candidatus Sumerlaeota bacterium]